MIQILLETIRFQKATREYQNIILDWLAEPHMQEFWDNSPEHKDDIINFINGRQTPSNYFNGIFTYWIGFINNEPYCFILTAKVTEDSDLPDVWKENLSKTGTTYSLDFGIGNTTYLGKKLASPTLRLFTKYFRSNIDSTADTFFIDPAKDNARAIHVYEEAGFEKVGDFKVTNGVFSGEDTLLLIKRYHYPSIED